MKRTMLIVDDMEVNRVILGAIFKDKYNIVEAENGLKAIGIIEKLKSKIDIILLDIVMPVIDGFGVLEYLKNNSYMDNVNVRNIPVVLITGDTSTDVKKRGYRMGVSDVIEKPFDAFIVRTRISNIVELYYHKKNLEELVEKQTRKLKLQSKKLNDLNYRVIDTLGTVVEFRNTESGEHIFRVREFTRLLAACVAEECSEYKLTSRTVAVINYASAMHDVGKISIPDSILLKPGRLTDEEFNVMKSHTIRGAEIISRMDFFKNTEYQKYCLDIARSHHEKFDGSGYPDGLSGDDIPIAAQIVTIADVYDALVSKRVYKSAYATEEAYNMIMNGECGAINPKLLKCFAKIRKKFERMAVKEYR